MISRLGLSPAQRTLDVTGYVDHLLGLTPLSQQERSPDRARPARTGRAATPARPDAGLPG